jgi:hypothetical protein
MRLKRAVGGHVAVECIQAGGMALAVCAALADRVTRRALLPFPPAGRQLGGL